MTRCLPSLRTGVGMATGKRAGQAKSAFARAQPQQPAQPDPADAGTEQQPSAVPETESAAVRNKYTVTLSEDDALLWDDVAMRLRRKLGRRVSKSEVLRVLVWIAADDAALLDQVADTVRRHNGGTV